jgi:hypothetical protein
MINSDGRPHELRTRNSVSGFQPIIAMMLGFGEAAMSEASVATSPVSNDAQGGLE